VLQCLAIREYLRVKFDVISILTNVWLIQFNFVASCIIIYEGRTYFDERYEVKAGCKYIKEKVLKK
jgi:hypothetical protein